MSKFLNNLIKSNDGIKQARATALSKQTERAVRRIYEDLEEKLEDINTSISRLVDLSPKTSVDLAYRDDFDAKKWAEELHELNKKKYNLQIEIKVAKEVYFEWFSDHETGTAQ